MKNAGETKAEHKEHLRN